MDRKTFLTRAADNGWRLWKQNRKANMTTFVCAQIGCQQAKHVTDDAIARGRLPAACKCHHRQGHSAEVMDQWEALRDFLARRRKALGLSQEDLEAAAGLSVDHIGKLEISGRMPTFPTMWAWSQALGYDIALVPRRIPDSVVGIIAAKAGRPDPAKPLPAVMRAPDQPSAERSLAWLEGIAKAG